MYTQLAQNVEVTDTPQYSQAISMEGANTVTFNATVLNITGGVLTIAIEVGNDLENWNEPPSADKTFSSIGYGKKKLTEVSEAYVRLVYSMGSAHKAIIAAGVNTAEL